MTDLQSLIAECADSRKVSSCSKCLRYGDQSLRGCPYHVCPSTPFPSKALLASVSPDQLRSITKAIADNSVSRLRLTPFSSKERAFLSEPSNFPFDVFLQTLPRKRILQATALAYADGKVYLSNLSEPTSEPILTEGSEYPTQSVARLCYQAQKRC